MSGPIASDDPTLALWRAAQERKDCQKAEKQEQQSRLTELERAFSDVKFGMPEARDDEQSALAFAAKWGHIARLITKSPDHVHRPLDEIKADAHSSKDYALRFVKTAFANEADAVKLLLNSWQASKDLHSETLSPSHGAQRVDARNLHTDRSRRPLLARTETPTGRPAK